MAQSTETSPARSAAAAPFGPLRTFGLVIELPALILYVASVALVIFALAGMAREMNRLENARSITAMHAALDAFLNDLGSLVAEEGTWDEAYLNVVVNPDPAWMDTMWGATARLGQRYDTVLVTDQAGMIVFGEDAAGAIKGSIVQRYPAARTILGKLDEGIASTTDATTISHFATDIQGTLGLAAISIHRGTPGQPAIARDSRRILWIGRHLTPAVLQDISVRYQTPSAVLGPDIEADASSITVGGADGEGVGTLSWIPDRPGDAAFNKAILLVSVLFVCLGVALAMGLGILRQAMLRQLRAAVPATSAGSAGRVDPAGVPHGDRTAEAVAAVAEASPIAGVNASDFIIEYQPVIDVSAEALVGVDARLRWSGPDGSRLAAETLPPEECARLLDRIGMIALRRAADEIAPLLGLTLTFPVTPGQLASPVFVEKVAGTLGATNLLGRRLQLRIDASLVPAPKTVEALVRELRQRGVLLALNGFTLDVRSAAVLDERLFDRVRFDGSLIAQTAGPAADTYLGASIQVARAAGLTISATGIERREAAAALLRFGCREVQGSLFAPPMSLGALTQLVLAPSRGADVRKVG